MPENSLMTRSMGKSSQFEGGSQRRSNASDNDGSLY
jgi:hypothetical protein